MHHIQVLSSDFSRYLSHSIKILPDALGHNDAHGACAAGLPGICNVNLVSDTMGDGIPPSARSRVVFKPEKPTQDTPARAVCRVCACHKICSQRRTLCAKHTSFLMADAFHRMAKPAAQSVAQYLPPFAHTGRPPSAGRLVSLFCEQFRPQTRQVY